MNFTTIFYALLSGILPSLLWLWFWRREDKARPEPRGIILLTFIAGMIAVPLVLPLEKAILSIFGFSTIAIILWSAVEELFKYFAAYFTALRSKFFDEPIDALIYMITAALGFAALENAFFIIKPLADGDILQTILTGNLRFVGATLLHTTSSALIGGAIALSFYRHKRIKHHYWFVGVILAIALHALFNFLIIQTSNSSLFFVFGFIWILMVGLLLFFEKAKRIKNNSAPVASKTIRQF